MKMIKINALGDTCPIPVIKTKKAMDKINGPEIIEVMVDNEIAVQNVTKLAASRGAESDSETISEKEFKVIIRINGALEETEPESHSKEQSDHVVIAVASDRMGEGNDDLGKVLMKGFIFAVTQLDELPETMLFYNGGATLTAEGSDSLEDLKNLEEQGVEILTCGTCLNYYGMTDKLKVGTVTNMYSIVEKLAGADKIIRP